MIFTAAGNNQKIKWIALMLIYHIGSMSEIDVKEFFHFGSWGRRNEQYCLSLFLFMWMTLQKKQLYILTYVIFTVLNIVLNWFSWNVFQIIAVITALGHF